MPFRLSSTEITLKRSGLRIGYDYVQVKHALLLDADTVVVNAKPLEEGQNDALLVQARIPYKFAKSTLNDETLVIHPESLSPVTPRLENLSKIIALAGVVKGGEWREEKTRIEAYIPAPLVIRVEPEHRHVVLTIGPSYTRRAERLYLEARTPTLANILLDKIQAALLLYTSPVKLELESEGDMTRVRIVSTGKGEELGTTSKN